MGVFPDARSWYFYSQSRCSACRHYRGSEPCLIRAMHDRWQGTTDPEQLWALSAAIPSNGHGNGPCRMFADDRMDQEM